MADELGLLVRCSTAVRRQTSIYWRPVNGWSALLLSALITRRERDLTIAAACSAVLNDHLYADLPPMIVRFQRHPVGLAFARAFLDASEATVDWRTRAMRAHIA